jgi:hypothetical protein
MARAVYQKRWCWSLPAHPKATLTIGSFSDFVWLTLSAAA